MRGLPDKAVKLYYAFSGPVNGTVLGIFILGFFIPQSNSAGALAGGLTSLAAMSYIVYGARAATARGDIFHAPLPTSVDGCKSNFTMPSNSTLYPTSVSGRVFPMFEITVFYYGAMAAVISVAVGLVVSYATGSNNLNAVNRDLLSPLAHRFLPTYNAVPLKDKGAEKTENIPTPLTKENCVS